MNKVWHRICPFPIGTRVKVIKDNIRIAREGRSGEFIGRVGQIICYVDEGWKDNLIAHRCYPSSIKKETLYEVKFEMNDPVASSYAFRYSELEVV